MLCLQTVAGGQIELKSNHCYSLGRALDCDVVIEDIASSRHHARITVSAKGRNVVVEDLGSRNGTYVNDDRIDGRTPIELGTRIRIGATVYLLSVVDEADVDEDSLNDLDTGTVGLESLSLGRNVNAEILKVVRAEGQAGTEFAGQLGAFSLIEVLQLLIQTHRSGSLHVAVESGHAQIELRNGEVCAASFEDLEGFDALIALVQKKTGIFWLVEEFAPVTNSIRVPGASLLFELCRAIDEKDLV
ncbi:MAG: FHA domain-containing protein [Planctomycetota bacterium]|jgi:pSer/pThr/pTyr-binding forkhead associated (FHA) protein